MTAPIIAILALISVLLLLLILVGKNNHNNHTSSPLPIKDQPEAKMTLSTCPLCKTKLQKGELLHSARYPGINFDLIHIFGCPYCYPDHRRAVAPKNRKKRLCPVCLDTLPPGAHVLAEGTTQKGKNHMHVVGCSLCR